MRHPSTTRGTAAAIALLTAGTTFFTMLSWDGLSDDSSAFLVPLFWVCLAIAGVGLALRTMRVPAALVVLAQLVVLTLIVHRTMDVGGALGGLLPTPTSLEAVGTVFGRAVDATVEYAAPIPASATAFAPLMLAAGAAVALLVDLLACTFRRVPLAGLPLLAAFTAPVSLLGGVSWVAFALAATCFVLLLAADQASRLGTWGRSLAGPVTDSQPHTVGLGTVLPTATRIGFAGIGLAVLAPVLLPAGLGMFDRGEGPGSGGGGDEVEISNPMLNVRRDLVQGEDIRLLTFTTDDPAPAYLRLTVLDEFNGAAWIPADRNIPPANQVDGAMPEPPGLDSTTKVAQYEWQIEVTDELDSSWLPVPYPAANVQVEGDWRYDERTLDLFTPDEDTSTKGLAYEVVADVVQADTADLVGAAPPNRTVFLEGTRLPSSVPDWLEERAREVTDGGRSDFERAVMLQEWFRGGEFEYTTDRAGGNGTDTLELFLGTGPGSKRGYCEQFAAAMALLSRTLGIPARVAVGFLRPEQEGGVWVYSSHDMHAWPELYFEGTGWVRFEPTPQTEAGPVDVPDYTVGPVPAPEQLETPSASPTVENPDVAPPPEKETSTTTSEDTGPDVLRWLGWAAAVLLVAALLALPRVVRAGLRQRRLSGEHPDGLVEGAWVEVRATALDLHLGWDDGVTLRRRARALAPALAPAPAPAAAPAPVLAPAMAGGGPGASAPSSEDAAERSPVEALERLVLLLERSRFSRSGLPDAAQEEVPALADTITAAMRRAAKPSAQRRATWLPASLWRGRHSGPRRRNPSVDRIGELDRVSL